MRHPTLSGAELFCSNRVLLHRQLCGRGGSMSTMQAFFLGMIAAWTPSTYSAGLAPSAGTIVSRPRAVGLPDRAASLTGRPTPPSPATQGPEQPEAKVRVQNGVRDPFRAGQRASASVWMPPEMSLRALVSFRNG